MSEQSSDINHPAHKANFVEKIMDKFRHHPHGQDQQAHTTAAGQDQMMRGPENLHDNAYQGVSNVVGSHGVPPMAYQADPNYRQGQPQVPLSQGQTQPPQVQQRGQGYATTSYAYGQTQPTNMPPQ